MLPCYYTNQSQTKSFRTDLNRGWSCSEYLAMSNSYFIRLWNIHCLEYCSWCLYNNGSLKVITTYSHPSCFNYNTLFLSDWDKPRPGQYMFDNTQTTKKASISSMNIERYLFDLQQQQELSEALGLNKNRRVCVVFRGTTSCIAIWLETHH